MLIPALLQTSLLLWLAQETLQGGKEGRGGPNHALRSLLLLVMGFIDHLDQGWDTQSYKGLIQSVFSGLPGRQPPTAPMVRVVDSW